VALNIFLKFYNDGNVSGCSKKVWTCFCFSIFHLQHTNHCPPDKEKSHFNKQAKRDVQ